MESYDREMYDLVRSAFLKYSLQVRLGKMDGIFVTYHNTANIFGFQYLNVSDMDKYISGSTRLSHEAFLVMVKLLDYICQRITERFSGKGSIALLCDFIKLKQFLTLHLPT